MKYVSPIEKWVGFPASYCMLIYQRVDPSDTTKLGFLPGMGLAETSASGGQDRGLMGHTDTRGLGTRKPE